jgi:hypothetical protein
MAKKRDLDRGDRVVVTAVEQETGGERVPEDIVGSAGVIEWITPGFAGEKSVFEVRLDDGRVVNLYAGEIDPA